MESYLVGDKFLEDPTNELKNSSAYKNVKANQYKDGGHPEEVDLILFIWSSYKVQIRSLNIKDPRSTIQQEKWSSTIDIGEWIG